MHSRTTLISGGLALLALVVCAAPASPPARYRQSVQTALLQQSRDIARTHRDYALLMETAQEEERNRTTAALQQMAMAETLALRDWKPGAEGAQARGQAMNRLAQAMGQMQQEMSQAHGQSAQVISQGLGALQQERSQALQRTQQQINQAWQAMQQAMQNPAEFSGASDPTAWLLPAPSAEQQRALQQYNETVNKARATYRAALAAADSAWVQAARGWSGKTPQQMERDCQRWRMAAFDALDDLQMALRNARRKLALALEE